VIEPHGVNGRDGPVSGQGFTGAIAWPRGRAWVVAQREPALRPGPVHRHRLPDPRPQQLPDPGSRPAVPASAQRNTAQVPSSTLTISSLPWSSSPGCSNPGSRPGRSLRSDRRRDARLHSSLAVSASPTRCRPRRGSHPWAGRCSSAVTAPSAFARTLRIWEDGGCSSFRLAGACPVTDARESPAVRTIELSDPKPRSCPLRAG
jgi:hypothetical protein